MANYASQFKVVGSTADTDARDNTETTGTGVPIYWVNGNKLADGYSDFYDGSWDDETNIKDESGENRSSPLLIFTGSGNDGTESFVASSSRAFGMNNVRMGQLDAPGTVNSPLSGNFVATKNENYPFYGLSPVFTIATPVPDTWSLKPSGLRVGDGFRLIFLSSTKRNASSSSIGAYNTWIQGRAAAGHTTSKPYSDGFTAVGCTSEAKDARDNTSTTYTSSDKGVPIYWLGGNKVADEYEDFYDGSWRQRGQRQERVRRQRPRHFQLEQLPRHRLRPRRHREIPDSRWHTTIQIPRQQPRCRRCTTQLDRHRPRPREQRLPDRLEGADPPDVRALRRLQGR